MAAKSLPGVFFLLLFGSKIVSKVKLGPIVSRYIHLMAMNCISLILLSFTVIILRSLFWEVPTNMFTAKY